VVRTRRWIGAVPTARSIPEISDGPLHRLAWAWDAPLDLVPNGDHAHGWLLEQAERPVVAIDRRDADWSLSTAARGWEAGIRRRRHRLGWHLEVKQGADVEPVLCYYPRSLLSGGELVCTGGGCYKLNGPTLVRAEWILGSVDGAELARILPWSKQPTHSRRSNVAPGLSPGAVREPDLVLLLSAAALAILVGREQPAYMGQSV
jgi:hypothetical protein